MMPLAPFIILCIISIVGTIGNVFIIGAVCLRKKLRVRGNAFVVNLAVADLIITSYIMPIGLTTSQYMVNPFSQIVCEFNAFLILTSCGVSTQSLMMIGVERYVHICKPHWYQRIFTKGTCAGLVVVCWVYTIIWTCQGWTGWTQFEYYDRLYVCLFGAVSSFSYAVCLAVFGIILPMVVVSVCYYKIFRTVKESRRSLSTMKSESNSEDPAIKELNKKNKKRLQREQRFVVTLFTIVILFIIFWLPTTVVLALGRLVGNIPAVIFPIAVWTSFTNSCVNSVVYGAMNKNFRTGYIALFRCIFCCNLRKGTTSSQSVLSNDDSVSTSQQAMAKIPSPAASIVTEVSFTSTSTVSQAGTRHTYGTHNDDIHLHDVHADVHNGSNLSQPFRRNSNNNNEKTRGNEQRDSDGKKDYGHVMFVSKV